MTKAKLYQLELNQSEVNCGMSYIMQLQDGRFILIDGGYFTPGEDERLYRFLAQRSTEGIEIAAWFFSHPHQDHVGNFINFVRRYADKVQIEGLYYNNPPMELPRENVDFKSSDPATVKEFYRVVEDYFPKERVHTPKTGEVLRFGEVSVEILYTQEDLWPTVSTINDYSMVFTTEIDGQKILWLGDVYKLGCDYLLNNKLAQLACDIVQISHHGYSGATKELYESLNATTALWPTPDYRMGELDKLDVDHYLLHDSSVREHIVSGQGTAELELPYTPGTARRLQKEFFALFSLI